MNVRNNDGLEEKKELPAQGTQVESTDAWIARLQEAPYHIPKRVLDTLVEYYSVGDFENLNEFLLSDNGLLLNAFRHFNWPIPSLLAFSSEPPSAYMHLYGDIHDDQHSLGMPAIHFAVMAANEPLLRFLIDHKLNVNQVDSHDVAPLISACENGPLTLVQLLIDAGANVNYLDQYKSTALQVACLKNHLAIVECLLENGADVNQAGPFGNTPLFLACKKGLVEVAETLIAYGADINMSSRSATMALWLASKRGDFNIVKLFLDHGAVVEEVDTANMSPHHDEMYWGDPFMYSCVQGRFDLVKLWLEYGVNVNRAFRRGETPFWVVCSRGHLDIVQLMFEEYGADMTQVDDYGSTPLHAACTHGHFDVAQYLLDHGANPHTKNNVGRTVLSNPLFYQNWSLVELLIDRMGFAEKHGFDKDLLLKRCRDDHHRIYGTLRSGDPLLMASSRGHVDVMTLLAEHGADIRSNDGQRIYSVHGTIKMMREFYQNIPVLDDVSVFESKEEIGGIDGYNVEGLQQSVERCQILLSALTYVSEYSEDAAFKDQIASLNNDFYVSYLLLATLDIVKNQEIIHECLGHITTISDETIALEIAEKFCFHKDETIGKAFFWRLAEKVDFNMDSLAVLYSGMIADQVDVILNDEQLLQGAKEFLALYEGVGLFSNHEDNALVVRRKYSPEAQHAYDKRFGIVPV